MPAIIALPESSQLGERRRDDRVLVRLDRAQVEQERSALDARRRSAAAADRSRAARASATSVACASDERARREELLRARAAAEGGLGRPDLRGEPGARTRRSRRCARPASSSSSRARAGGAVDGKLPPGAASSSAASVAARAASVSLSGRTARATGCAAARADEVRAADEEPGLRAPRRACRPRTSRGRRRAARHSATVGSSGTPNSSSGTTPPVPWSCSHGTPRLARERARARAAPGGRV